MRSTTRWGECDSSRSSLLIIEALQILLVSYMPLGCFFRSQSQDKSLAIEPRASVSRVFLRRQPLPKRRADRPQPELTVQTSESNSMEPSATAREGACDSYPFPEPTRPPASGEELFQSSGHAARRGWLVGQWDSVPDCMKEDFNNRARLAMERYEAALDRWRREHSKRYYSNKVGAETLSCVVVWPSRPSRHAPRKV